MGILCQTVMSSPLLMMNKDVSSHRRMQRDQECPSTSSNLDSGSGCDSEDGAVSTSENADAIYEEKVESECDLMKETMRATYSKSTSSVQN